MKNKASRLTKNRDNIENINNIDNMKHLETLEIKNRSALLKFKVKLLY
ncbi:hypothetical protein KLL70_13845 [Clostridioides difficile]|nr:hypothetical protein [Clostridioides difficile]HBF5372260.1 hypothetical protein [Clostridioides difficile]